MADQVKNLMIGLFVTAAAVIVIFILMFLHPNIGNEAKIIKVRFADIDKINVGTRVTYAGKPVGEVVGINEVEVGRGGKTDPEGRVYLYELTLRVDSGVHIYNTDQVSIRTSGLLGERNVEITPYAPKPDQHLVLMDDHTIYAVSTLTVEDTFKEIKVAASKLDATLASAKELLDNIKRDKLVDKVTETVENVRSITHALNKPDQWSHILANLDKLFSRANQTWDNVDKAVLSIDDAADSAKQMMAKGVSIVDNIAAGKGTLGKLLVDDETYLRLNSLLGKGETILDDINHYGILFQMDKGWQRLRARRMNLMQKLRSPQEFRNYFNDEVDQITTSLSRVYMVLNEVQNSPCACDVMQDREFNKVFAELMRRTKMLEEEVRLYNIQVAEARVHERELGEVPCYPGCEYRGCCYDPLDPCQWQPDPWMWMPQYQ